MKRKLLKSSVGLMAVVAIAVPASLYASMPNTINVDGEVWRSDVNSGQDVCALVREEKGSCDYSYYDIGSRTHFVTTTSARAEEDRLIVKNQNDEIIDDFRITSGTDHRTAVAERRGIERSQVQWLSGDTEFNRDYQYEAILLVVTGEDSDVPVGVTQDRIIVKDSNKEIIADFMVDSGIDHVDAVVAELDVSRESVEWLSGDTELDRDWGYEAILLVR